MLGGKPIDARWGDAGLDDTGVGWREFEPLGGLLLRLVSELLLKAGSEEEARPVDCLGRDCKVGMAAGADIECGRLRSAGFGGGDAGGVSGGTMSVSRDPIRSHA